MIWQDGVTEGEARGKADAYVEMIRDGYITEKEAARRLNISEEEMEKLLEK